MLDNFQSFKQGGYVGQGNTANDGPYGFVAEPRKIQIFAGLGNSYAKAIMQELQRQQKIINSSRDGSDARSPR